jgi:hypothetical protein
MDRNILLDDLAHIERQPRWTRPGWPNQQVLIADLVRDGHDTNEAIIVLAALEEVKEQHEQARERILRALFSLHRKKGWRSSILRRPSAPR